MDGRSHANYERGGDVVTFETTHRMNKYELPFAPFSVVDHDYGILQFDCALLQAEIEVSFLELFSIWLQVMENNIRYQRLPMMI